MLFDWAQATIGGKRICTGFDSLDFSCLLIPQKSSTFRTLCRHTALQYRTTTRSTRFSTTPGRHETDSSEALVYSYFGLSSPTTPTGSPARLAYTRPRYIIVDTMSVTSAFTDYFLTEAPNRPVPYRVVWIPPLASRPTKSIISFTLNVRKVDMSL